jgi:hypothetical protein
LYHAFLALRTVAAIVVSGGEGSSDDAAAALAASLYRWTGHLSAVLDPAARVAVLEGCFALLFLRASDVAATARGDVPVATGESAVGAASPAPAAADGDRFLVSARAFKRLLTLLRDAVATVRTEVAPTPEAAVRVLDGSVCSNA